jgi:hypothetical protein
VGTSGALVAPWSPPSMVKGLGLSQLVLAAAASSVGMLVCVSVCFGTKILRQASESMADSGAPPLSSGGVLALEEAQAPLVGGPGAC